MIGIESVNREGNILFALFYHLVFCLLATLMMKGDCLLLISLGMVGGAVYLLYWIITARKAYMPWSVYLAFCAGTVVQAFLCHAEIFPADKGFFSGLGRWLYGDFVIGYAIILGIVNLIMYLLRSRRVLNTLTPCMLNRCNALITPVGEFSLFVNGIEQIFTATKRDMAYYPDAGELPADTGSEAAKAGELPADIGSEAVGIRPEALFRVELPLAELHRGDVIVGRICGAGMEPDGGDEHTMNMIGVRDGYTYGLGTVDDCELNRENEDPSVPFHLNRVLEDGFEITIIGEPQNYSASNSIDRIFFDVAWIGGTGDIEWSVISFVTC